jgi:proton glutamate symport protein
MISSFIQRPLYQQIFVAILLALAIGIGIQLTVAEETIPQVVAGFDFFGSLFIQALKMLIVPLITSAIISAMANIGQEKGFGRLAWKTLAYYITTSLLAIIVGLILVNWIAPGIIDGRPASEVIELPSSDEATLSKAEGRGAGDVIDVFKRMVPPNVLKAAVEGQMLGLICFSILFGFFLSRVNGSPGESLKNFWLGLYEVMLKITDLIMRFAPIGVFRPHRLDQRPGRSRGTSSAWPGSRSPCWPASGHPSLCHPPAACSSFLGKVSPAETLPGHVLRHADRISPPPPPAPPSPSPWNA